ncbi:hypothetical protein IJZ97_04170 [bacterium]|nr:hypothetical protein [bacterium]
MQINSIGANLAQARVGQSFSGKRENIDAFINLDDQAIRNVATLKTLESVDTEKHKKLNRSLFAVLPLAAGLAVAARNSKGARGAAFVVGTAISALSLGAIGLTVGAENALRNKSEKVDNFARKNPITSFMLSLGLALGASEAASRAGYAGLASLVSNKSVDKFLLNAEKSFKKFGNKRFVKPVKEGISNVVAKTPSALKSLAKGAASFAPAAVAIGYVAHAIDHSMKVSNEYNKNYSTLKEKQLNLARRRVAELSVQNDFLLTNPQNVEDLDALKNTGRSV